MNRTKRLFKGIIFLVLAGTAVYGQDSSATLITSGRVNTLGKFSFQYGRLDISVKFPRTGNGLWPALWLLGADYGKTSWPDCGEIDLLEMGHYSGIEAGTQDKLFSSAVHWGPAGEDGSHPNYAVFRTNSYGLQYGVFHLLTLIWNPRYIRMYLDLDKLSAEQKQEAIPYFEMEITPELEKYFCKPFSIVINLAVAGNYTGITGRDGLDRISALNEKNKYEAAMYIDFIRVFNQEGSLIFYDDFNGSRLDSSRWNVEVNNDGGGNQELQVYRRQNVRLDKDRTSGKTCLILSAKREP